MKGINHSRWFGWLSLVIVVGYFVVGLWPFEFHSLNRVSWLPNRSGLHFEPYGIAYDSAPLPTAGSGQSAVFTVELWLETQHEPANDVLDILTIHNPQLPYDFTLCQWKWSFLLRGTTEPHQRTGRIPQVGMGDALSNGKAQFITIRGSKAGTDFYLNGKAAGHFPHFMLAANALNGQLILGNDASGKQSWIGSLLGLAIYHRALDTAEIARHCTLWTQSQAGQLTNASGLRALYLFDEGHGQQANDVSDHRHHLIIPAAFQPVHRDFLIAPSKDNSNQHLDYSDIVINVLGFMPFGFCFFLYRRSLKPNRAFNNVLRVVLAGATVSLMIEVTQAWLPNRVSSTMDLLTNTTGALLGAALALAMLRKLTKAQPASEIR